MQRPIESTRIVKSLNLPASTSLDEMRDLIGAACREWASGQSDFDGGYVVEVYNEEVVYCAWGSESAPSKYWRLSWKNEGRTVTVSDPTEVVRATSFVAISKSLEIAEAVRVPPTTTPSIFQSLVGG